MTQSTPLRTIITPPESEELRRPLTSAAARALQEAAERRAALQGAHTPPETGGRSGPDPVRYGDWEHGGIASDF